VHGTEVVSAWPDRGGRRARGRWRGPPRGRCMASSYRPSRRCTSPRAAQAVAWPWTGPQLAADGEALLQMGEGDVVPARPLVTPAPDWTGRGPARAGPPAPVDGQALLVAGDRLVVLAPTTGGPSRGWSDCRLAVAVAEFAQEGEALGEAVDRRLVRPSRR
jgi:hypothetical protein